MPTKKTSRRKAAPKRALNPRRATVSTGRKAMLAKASRIPGARKMTATQRMALVRAEDLLDEGERFRAVEARKEPSDYPDTSWMDARAMRDYRDGRTAFYDVSLVDLTTGRVIDSLGESHVRDNDSGDAYLKSIVLDMVIANKAAVIAAIKRKQGRRVENPGRRKATRRPAAKRRATPKRRPSRR